MSIKNGNDFQWVYQRYLEWFQEHARPSAAPWGEDKLLETVSHYEDVFENERLILNRMFYTVALLPSESKIGLLERFTFSQLTLMEKVPMPDGTDEIFESVPVEHTLL